MADDMTSIVVNPLPPRRRDDVVAHLAAPKNAADNAAAAGALPPGWLEVHNNPVGAPMYYAHLQTRETSWVLPAAEPPALSAAAVGTTIVVNPLPSRRRDDVVAHLPARTAGAEFFFFIEDSGEIATSFIQAAKDFVPLLASGRVTPSTLVWAQSLGEWTALRNVPALASMVALASENETNVPDETAGPPSLTAARQPLTAAALGLGTRSPNHRSCPACPCDRGCDCFLRVCCLVSCFLS